MTLNRLLIQGSLTAAVIASSSQLPLRAAPLKTVGACSSAVVVERHYGEPHRSDTGMEVEEVYLSLSDGEHLDGPAVMGTTGFFWNYTPGNKVEVCVEALKPLRVRVDDRMTGASFVMHPTATHRAGG